MHGHNSFASQLIDMRRRIQTFIRERNDTELERNVGTESQPLARFISKLHPTDIRTISRSLRTDIIVEHALYIGMINADAAGRVAVDVGFVLATSQISDPAISIRHLKSKSNTCQ